MRLAHQDARAAPPARRDYAYTTVPACAQRCVALTIRWRCWRRSANARVVRAFSSSVHPDASVQRGDFLAHRVLPR